MALPTDLNQLNRTSFSEVGNTPARRVDLVSAPTLFAVVNTGAVGGSGGTIFQGTRPWEISTSSLPTIFAVTAGANTGNVTLNPSPNFIGLISAASIQGKVELVASSAHIGSVSVFGSITANTGMTTLFPGPNFIGLVSTASIHGRVEIMNISAGATVFQGTSPWNSLGTVTLGSMLPTGTNHVGSVTIYGSLTANTGMTTLFPGPNFIGLVSAASIHGRVEIMNISAGATVFQGTTPWNSLGTTTLGSMLPTGTNFIGLVTVSGVISNVNLASSNFIGLVSAASIHAKAELVASSAFVGLATVIPSFAPLTSTYTSFATVISAAGNATVFVPPNGQRWIAKDIIVGVQGSVLVAILSGGTTKIPSMSLATQSGYISSFGDSGLRAVASNDSFGINLGSAATVTVFANVRFE